MSVLCFVAFLAFDNPFPDPLELTPEIKTFLHGELDRIKDPKNKLHDIIGIIFDEKRLNLQYAEGLTMTAAETYQARSGNCLSFTNLFIAMAREMGFTAYFKEVIDFSTYDRAGQLVRHNRHIIASVMIQGRVIDFDFQPSLEKRYKRTRLVNDARGYAHFYNNLGAEAFEKGQLDRAKQLYDKAFKLDPTFVPVQINLGVYFRTVGEPQRSIDVYEKVLKKQPRNFTVMANLARSYQDNGQKEKFNEMVESMKSTFNRNPYFYGQLAEWAFAEQKYDEALSNYRKALNFNYREPIFYQGLSKTYYALGRVDDAKDALEKAMEFAKDGELNHRYSLKMDLLAGLENK
ncbi:MAG: tetratricopeptide repeat protein [Acidobacteria bacterium]|nr:tetratricopeptide repeat protein [Acidobacteriota bacterium]MCB9399560.1 tetratricopeptide repeat protein [Acidobacteriota bacterium]